MRKFHLLILMIACCSVSLTAQERDKLIVEEYDGGYYYNTILKDLSGEQEKKDEKKVFKRFKVDIDASKYPTDPEKYTSVWHGNPVSQGNTGTCWCFATTSFYESEIKRLTGKEIKLSEMYTVYWEYVERAKFFVKSRGEMYLGEGSETNAVAKIMKMYGAVPHKDYPGKKPGQKFHTHEQMFEEIENYLASVKAQNMWNEKQVVSTVRSILNHHMGEVPSTVKFNGTSLSPEQYLKSELELKPDDYIDFMSLMEKPYFDRVEYEVPDNWWNSDVYHNIPLKDFMNVIKSAVKEGYSVSIGGDVSEAGFVSTKQVAIVPSFDIPSEYIDESARQFRFTNETTTDDHAMHLVGYLEKDGKTWYLVKDSGSGSRGCGEGCKSFGYYFFHEDYIKLKMMSITLHKDAAKELLKKFSDS